MADFANFGGTDEENAEIKRLNADVETDTDNFENWEKLIRACEGLEGGLNRNSSPQALATLRDSYDRFLLKFPLLFGYWKKYADLEFNISGPESAEMVCFRSHDGIKRGQADTVARCTRGVAPASPTRSICGLSTVLSRWKPLTLPTL
jgi:hypothetical protein